MKTMLQSAQHKNTQKHGNEIVKLLSKSHVKTHERNKNKSDEIREGDAINFPALVPCF